MDLEVECSGLEFVEDNEVINSERLANLDGNKIENNGSCGSEHSYDQLEDIEVKPYEGSAAPATAKGYGLKKWRRIRRGFSEDSSGILDPSRILKRGFSASAVNSTRPRGLSIEMKQKSNSSLPSTKAMVKDLGVGSKAPNFVAGTDSENSEDRSSKSSTAASAPKPRYEMPMLVGYARTKNRMKVSSGKNVINVAQRGEKGKNLTETSKKPRGEQVKIEKENSHSSMESDSRSSNFVFVQGGNSVTSSWKQTGRSTSYDGENSDDDQEGVQRYSEELQTGYNSKQNVQELEDLCQEGLPDGLSWDVKEEKVEKHSSSTDKDPLVESIFTLQSAQEALEREVQKLKEIGEILPFDSSTRGSSSPSEFPSIDPKIHEASSSDPLHAGEITHNSSDFSETQVTSLKQNVDLLECKLEEVNAVLKAKDAKVIELEHALKGNGFSKEDATESQQREYREMESELEGIFMQKLEAEVEYLAISRTIPQVKVAATDQVSRFEEPKTPAVEQPRMFNELGDAESKTEKLKRRVEESSYYEAIVSTDEVLKLQKRVFKVTTCVFVQSMLLVVVFVLFFLQLAPHYAGVVPT